MKKLICCALLVFLIGCTSPKPNFYQPIAVKTADIEYNNVNGIILLQTILLPAEVSRPQMTTIGQYNYELKIDEFNRWGAAPERLFMRVINQDLSTYLPHAIIENQTPLRKDYKYAVAIEIDEMGGKLKESAWLKASYFIKNKNGYIIRSGRFYQTEDISGGYDDYVPAQSMLLGALSAQIAGELSKIK